MSTLHIFLRNAGFIPALNQERKTLSANEIMLCLLPETPNQPLIRATSRTVSNLVRPYDPTIIYGGLVPEGLY